MKIIAISLLMTSSLAFGASSKVVCRPATIKYRVIDGKGYAVPNLDRINKAIKRVGSNGFKKVSAPTAFLANESSIASNHVICVTVSK